MSGTPLPYLMVGGRPCLDFVNTANWAPDGTLLEEKLIDAEALQKWCDAIGLKGASKWSGPLPGIIAFRGSLRRLLVRSHAGKSIDPDDLAPLNDALAGLPQPLVSLTPEGLAGLAPKATVNQAMALSALALLTDPKEMTRLRLCPGDGCAWLFLDESRTGRRRWCSMETCGNRAKARRHYRRHKT